MSRLMVVVSFATLVAGDLVRAQTVEPPAETTTASAPMQGRSVQQGETLMSLSREWLDVLVAAGVPVTLSQVLVATYRANPEAFGRNMNDLMVGAIIRFPPAGAVLEISRREALEEVRKSLGIWSPKATPTVDVKESTEPEPAPTPTPAPAPTPAAAAPSTEAVPMVIPPALFEERLTRIEAELEANQRRLDELARMQAEVQAPRSNTAGSSVTNFAPGIGWVWLLGAALMAALIAAIIVWRRRVQAETEEALESSSSPPDAPAAAMMPSMLDSRAIEGGGGIGRRLLDLGPRPMTPQASTVTEELEGDPPPLQEARSLIDLARAYLEMGEVEAARQELTHALELGSETEREEARRLLTTLPSA